MHFVLDLMLFISSQPKGLVDTGKWRGRRRGRGSFYRETNQCESVRLTPAKSSFAKDLHSIVLLKLKIFTALSCSNQRSSRQCLAQFEDLHSIVLLKSKRSYFNPSCSLICTVLIIYHLCIKTIVLHFYSYSNGISQGKLNNFKR